MNGWELLSLSAENLFSYHTLKVTFEPVNKTMLVVGRNLDDAGADSNGAGKSSFFDVITWIIWGDTPRSSNFTSDILRRGATSGKGSLTLWVPGQNEKITIERSKGEDSNYLRFFRCVESDFVCDMTLRTVTLTQQAICRFFGYDPKDGFSDYLSQVYFSSMSTEGFLGVDVNPSERQEVLERFLNLHVFDEAKRLVKEDIRTKEGMLAAVQAKLDAVANLVTDNKTLEELDVEHSNFQKQFNEATKTREALENTLRLLNDLDRRIIESKERFEDETANFASIKNKAVSLFAKYNKHKEVNAEHIQAVTEWRESQFAVYTDLLKRVSIEQENLAGATSASTAFLAPKNELKAHIKSAMEALRRKEEQLRGLLCCPNCSAQLMLNGNELLVLDKQMLIQDCADWQKELQVSTEKLSVLDEQWSQSIDLANTIRVSLHEMQQQLSGLEKAKAKVETIPLTELDAIEKEMADFDITYQNAKNEFASANNDCVRERELFVAELKTLYEFAPYAKILNLEESLLEAQRLTKIELTKVCKQCDECLQKMAYTEVVRVNVLKSEEVITVATAEANDLRAELRQLEYWASAYTEIKRQVIDAFVPVFEATVNSYLCDFSISGRVRFRTQSETKAGGVKNGFVIEVYGGDSWARLNSFSGGEKSRILVAAGFALRELAMQRVNQNGFGFLFVDELLDKIDTTGISFFFSLVNRLPGQKLIVTHTKADDVRVDIDRVLTVIKQDGKSHVEG